MGDPLDFEAELEAQLEGPVLGKSYLEQHLCKGFLRGKAPIYSTTTLNCLNDLSQTEGGAGDCSRHSSSCSRHMTCAMADA